MLLIPAILTNDLGELTSLITKAEGTVDRLQIDVIDQRFANNITVDPTILKNINTILNLDFHLMVKGPSDWIDHCTIGPKNRIIGQIEMMVSQQEFVEKVIAWGSLAGLALDLPTPIANLDQSLLSRLDVILLMSVPAGKDGQEFDLSVFPKIDQLIKIRTETNSKFKICIDGGVTKELVHDMTKLGVDEITVGKRIFEPNLKDNLKLFEDVIPQSATNVGA